MTVSSLELVVDFGWLKLVMIWLMNFGWCEQAMISSLDLTGATYNSIGNTMILGEDGEYICYIFFVLKFLEFVFNTIMPCEYRVLINNITLLFGTFNSTFPYYFSSRHQLWCTLLFILNDFGNHIANMTHLEVLVIHRNKVRSWHWFSSKVENVSFPFS